MKRLIRIAAASAVAMALAVIVVSSVNKGHRLYRSTRLLMGTYVEVISPRKDAAPIVFTEIQRVEGLLSKYRPKSDIARLNRLGETAVEADTLMVLRRAKEWYVLTQGAFDVTVGPLMDAWGFSDKQYRIPDLAQREAARGAVGMDKLVIDDENRKVSFSAPGMKVDLGGIAKGYAVDAAVRKIKEAGIKSCLINAGGNIYCVGTKFGRPWNIAVRNPRFEDVIYYFDLQDQGVATSGDYEQFFLKDGVRYSHIMDPRTGAPVANGVVSVTVIAPDATTADGLSTSLFVLGKDAGMKFASTQKNVRAIILDENDVLGRDDSDND